MSTPLPDSAAAAAAVDEDVESIDDPVVMTTRFESISSRSLRFFLTDDFAWEESEIKLNNFALHI